MPAHNLQMQMHITFFVLFLCAFLLSFVSSWLEIAHADIHVDAAEMGPSHVLHASALETSNVGRTADKARPFHTNETDIDNEPASLSVYFVHEHTATDVVNGHLVLHVNNLADFAPTTDTVTSVAFTPLPSIAVQYDACELYAVHVGGNFDFFATPPKIGRAHV